MNHLYPVFLLLSAKSCVVVGGGRIALQKTRSLVESEAKVTVISPEILHELEAMAAEKKIIIQQRGYESGDLAGVFLVIAATDNRELNARVRQEAKERNVLCNVVDDPEFCDFYVPSIHTTGDLKIAISSNAMSPAISKKLRKEMGELYGPTVAEALRLMAQAREKLKKEVPDYKERGKILSGILGDRPLYEMEREGEAALERLREALSRWI